MSLDDKVSAIEVSVGIIGEKVTAMEQVMVRVAEALERLARLEERHYKQAEGLNRAFVELAKVETKWTAIDDRLSIVEVEMPSLKTTRKWVQAAVVSVVGVVGLALIGMVIVK